MRSCLWLNEYQKGRGNERFYIEGDQTLGEGVRGWLGRETRAANSGGEGTVSRKRAEIKYPIFEPKFFRWERSLGENKEREKGIWSCEGEERGQY